jgi:SAM-dependent methyltransferase
MSELSTAAPDQRCLWEEWYATNAGVSHSDHAGTALQVFLDALPATGDLHVLDAGCGEGREAISLAQQGIRVSAFDFSRTALAVARLNAISENVDVDFREHDSVKPLPYPSHEFNGVFAHLSLHYFDDAQTTSIFAEIARILKPGGVLLFTVRSVHDPRCGQGDAIERNVFSRKGKIRHFFDESYIADLLNRWDVRDIASLNEIDSGVNPGVFLRVFAVPR